MDRKAFLEVVKHLAERNRRELEEDLEESDRCKIEHQLQKVEVVGGKTVRTYQDYLVVPAKELGKPDKRYFVRQYQQ